jgi:uncharacterized coiled-coil DUF342 family protein
MSICTACGTAYDYSKTGRLHCPPVARLDPESMVAALAEIDRLRNQLDDIRTELANVAPLLITTTQTLTAMTRVWKDYRSERDAAEALVEELREENAALRCRIDELGDDL